MKNKFFTLKREIKTLDYLIADPDSAFEYVIVSRKAARRSSSLRGGADSYSLLGRENICPQGKDIATYQRRFSVWIASSPLVPRNDGLENDSQTTLKITSYVRYRWLHQF